MPDDLFRWVVAIAVALAAIAAVVQAFLFLGMYRILAELRSRIAAFAERTEPVLDSARQLLEENRPKIAEITAEALDVTRMGKAEMARISELVAEISDRARIKIASLDAAIDEATGNLQHTASTVRHAVVRPLREISGLLNGVRAALSTLVYGRREYVDRATQDEEMFI